MKHGITRAMVCGIALAGLLSACGPQEKPAELVQLEELRNSEEAAQINGVAPDAYKVCTDLTNKSLDAWQDKEQDKAKLYAGLAQRQYATARAVAKTKEAKDRQEAAEKEIKETSLKLETMKAKHEGFEKSVGLMKQSISDNSMANVESRMQLATTEREKALGVKADETQKAAFEAADLKFKEAGDKNANGMREEAGAAFEEARLLYSKAYELAKPEFDKKQSQAQSAERQKALFEEAKSIVGPDYVFTDMKSVVIVLAGAFDKGKTDLLPVKQEALKRIAELIKKNTDASIVIEGHVQKGTSSSKSFEISQRRCDATRDYLVTLGVDYQRMMLTAKGKDVQRFDEKKGKENKAKNDRVEVIITLP